MTTGPGVVPIGVVPIGVVNEHVPSYQSNWERRFVIFTKDLPAQI